MQQRILFFLLILMLSFKISYSQSIYTRITETGKIVFSNGNDSSFITAKKRMAFLFNKYIYKYYPKRKLPLIYLVITKDEALANEEYELSYDNLYGNSLNNGITNKKGKYYKSGIRIQVINASVDTASLLKLLDYGINNLAELKSLRNKAIREGAETSAALKLPSDKIAKILSAATSEKIKKMISK